MTLYVYVIDALQGVAWTQLKRVQRQRVVRSMYVWLFVVPVAAKSLALLESPAKLDLLGYSLSIDLSLPFSWSAFYFAAVAFVVGSLVYAKACPKIIQENDSYATFRADGKDRRHLADYKQEIGFDLDIHDPQDDGSAYGDPSYEPPPHETRFQEQFWTIFEAAEGHNKMGVRVACSLYAIGLFLVFWVALQNLKTVVQLVS